MNTQNQRRTFVILFVLLALSVLTPVGIWLRSRDRAAAADAPRVPANLATGRAVDRRLAVVSPLPAARVGAARAAGSTRALSPLGLRIRELLRDLDPATVRPGELVVVFSDLAAHQEFLAGAAIAGFPIHGQIPELAAVRLVPGSDPADETIAILTRVLEPLANEIVDLGPNRKMFLSVPSRPEETLAPLAADTLAFLGIADQALAADNASGRRPAAWGRDFMIALLDTGVDPAAVNGERVARGNDPALLGTLDAGWGTVPADLHGSGVAAVLARVAPGARILGVRVTDDDGVSDGFAAAQGIVSAGNVGANLIQLSPAGSAPALVLERAIGLVAERGQTVVASTGGDAATWPAADPRVIAIGSLLTRPTALGEDAVGTSHLTLDQTQLDSAASAAVVAGALADVMSVYPGTRPADAWAALQAMSAEPGAERTGIAAAFSATGLQVLNLSWVGRPLRLSPDRGGTGFPGNLAGVGGGQRGRSGNVVPGRVLTGPALGGRRGADNRGGGAEVGRNPGANAGRNTGRTVPVPQPDRTVRGTTVPIGGPDRGAAR